MKITIRLANLILVFVGTVLLSISTTGILFGLATPQYHESWRGSEWIIRFPAAYPMLAIGVGLLIGGLMSVYGERHRKAE